MVQVVVKHVVKSRPFSITEMWVLILGLATASVRILARNRWHGN